MQITSRRFALTTGVSLSALGLVMPAYAAPHDAVAPGVYPGDHTSADTIEICDLATPSGSPCFFGVADTGIATSTAIVNSTANGQVEHTQAGANVTLTMTNSGSAEVGAIAEANNGAGAANAVARVFTAVSQSANATGDASASIINDGMLLIDALASATGTEASARAQVFNGINQDASATGTGDAVAAIANGGTLTISALATADADTLAIANATIGGFTGFFGLPVAGIEQQVRADNGTALASIANDGVLNIEVSAIANGGGTAVTTFFGFPAAEASANALIVGGIHQSAVAAGSLGLALVTLENGTAGSINVAAHASANAATANASANAELNRAIHQDALGNAGADAAVDVVNLGVIDVSASATANALTTAGDPIAGAVASAVASNVIELEAESFGGDASVALDNSGSIAVAAVANAVGLQTTEVVTGTFFGFPFTVTEINPASAHAQIFRAIDQDVEAQTGAARAVLTNSGSIALTVEANANQSANADLIRGIFQSATAASSATASLLNSGTIALGASANAVIGGLGNGTAFATVETGIGQFASGTAATVNLINDGTIDMSAVGNASAAQGSAFANADLTMIHQQAVGSLVTLTNNGLINGTASANAVAAAFASASATIDGITQSATGATATAEFFNAGTVDLNAVANATGSAASAFANVSWALLQDVNATVTGHAIAANSGIIDARATAHANATAGAADATAVARGIFQDVSAGSGGAFAEIVNDGTLDVVGAVSATGDTFAGASAFAYGASQVASATDGGDASALFDNNGIINVAATADAVSNGAAQALALARHAALQQVTAVAATDAAGRATASILNDGSISLAADAVATGTSAFALATANNVLMQFVSAQANGTEPSGNATALITNEGTFNVNGSAAAMATGNATALAIVGGRLFGVAVVVQDVDSEGGDALASFNNAGTANIAANATATGAAASGRGFINRGIFQVVTAAGTGIGLGGGDAIAEIANDGVLSLTAAGVANAAMGPAIAAAAVGTFFGGGGVIDQNAWSESGDAEVMLVNSGILAMTAAATAVADAGAARATGFAYGVVQDATALNGSATVSVLNSGSMTLAAIGNAVGSGNAFASMTAVGVDQSASAGAAATGLVSFDNTGSFAVTAVGNATAADNVFDTVTDPAAAAATAFAAAVGVTQNAIGGNAQVFNSGTLEVAASAHAAGVTLADAVADAVGVRQAADGVGMFQNSGEFAVTASALAAATAGTATASAVGYFGSAIGAGSATFDVVNGGNMAVDALAESPGIANALATGIGISATGTLAGTVSNSGNLSVVASALGGPVATPTLATATTPGSFASALGISLNSGLNTMVVTNSGAINVDAITGGGVANATGVLVTATGLGVPAGDLFTFVNDGGTIVVRESVDGGATWTRGMAIDVATAPNPSVINLLGDGAIYGSIDIAATDEINVQAGDTYLDGIINPEFLPVGGVTAADLDTGLFGEGVLNIDTGGNLILADPRITGDPDMYDGPAYAFVETLNMGATGSLTYELQPSAGGTQPVGTYPQVFTNVANLDGTLVADITTPNGLFADSYFWNNVIDAVTRNGTFDACLIGAPYNLTPLLDLNCIYDGANNVDLGLERVAFNGIGGLTRNQDAVATALEAVYSTTLTGDFADLVAELFLLDDGDLVDAFDQLSGVEYANYLNAVRNNSFLVNSVVSDQIDCAIHIRGIDECRVPENRGRIWATGIYNDVEHESDDNAIGYDAQNWSAMVGGDYRWGNFSLGAFVGYRDLDVDYPDALVGSRISADGWQIGLYGAYDVGNFYIRGIGSYANLNGESERRMSIGTISAIATGSPDLSVWSFYGEAGGRFDLGNSWITPYIAIDRTSLELSDFAEGGGLGGNLEFDEQSESQTSGIIGLKWAGNWGGIIPEAKVAYRHDFTDDFGVDARFLGIGGSDFRKFEEYDDGSIIAGLSIAGALGSNFMGRLGYQGRFNDDVRDHGIWGSLTYLFGAPPPPPPPSPPSPPPPPPPPATKTCPDGMVVLATEPCPAPPPPPPPPPPAPERG